MNDSERPDSPWRIKSIPYENAIKPVKTNYGALLGACVFVIGIFFPAIINRYSFFSFLKSYTCNLTYLGVGISVVGLLVGALSLIFAGRSVRKTWKKIKVKCVDRQIKQEYSLDSDMGKTWAFILLCEFKYKGKIYQVTPSFWHTFVSRAGLIKFLDANISKDGFCYLYVNPDNPLQTELSNDGIGDLLLYK